MAIEEKELIYKSTALKMLGITGKSFDKLGLNPAKEVRNPNYKSGPPSLLFEKKIIMDLLSRPEIIALRPKKRNPIDYISRFEKRYKNKAEALSDVCNYMLELNRYAKHKKCSDPNKQEIYQLKNRLIKHLYQNDFCSDISIHEQDRSFESHFNRKTNQFIDGERWKVRYFVFGFLVNDIRYCWHQPEDCIDFHIKESDSPISEMNETEIKPLNMQINKMKEGKSLITWFLS